MSGSIQENAGSGQVTGLHMPDEGGIRRGDDGVYRWIYEFHMMKNPTILFTVWKVLGLAAAIVALFGLVITLPDMIRYGIGFDPSQWKIPVILIAVFFVISLLAYVIVAASFGWKYIVLFEMSEKELVHTQMPKQFKKAQALGLLAALSGVKAGNVSLAGQGLAAAGRNRSISEFAHVRTVRLKKRRNTIFVNQRLFHNQVYVRAEDFDFIAEYIIRYCPQAKVKGR